MSDTDSYRDVFRAESIDYLQQITDGLLALEANPQDTAPIEVIFRGAHSLKGMAAAMGYEKTADLTHKMESLVDRLRKGEMACSQPVVNLMLAAVDLVRDLSDDESNGLHNVDPASMIVALEQAAEVRPDSAADELTGTTSPVSVSDLNELSRWHLRVRLEESCVLKAVRAYMVIKRLNHMGEVLATNPTARQIEDEDFDLEFEVTLLTEASVDSLRDAVMQVMEVESVDVTSATPPEHDALTAGVTPLVPHVSRRSSSIPRLSETQTVRVAISHLDTLVDLAGELVILRSRLEGLAAHRHDAELAETMDELQRISTDLQYEVMQTRMVPVGNIFNRFPRMVRDLSVELGKRVDFQMLGLDIELDRTVLDEIGDPLVHLLRNSIDHGVESPEVRRSLGKSEVGHVVLSASRERDHVAITVSDDGKGISCEGVWNKAVERGFVRADARHEYEDKDVLLLTCLPGFSTAETTTKVSGRGVGMDVVKGKVEHLGGTIEIHAGEKFGTSLVMRLPLTLAIVQALLVDSGGQTYAIPLSSVEEVISADEATLDSVDGAPVVVMRDGAVVPLYRLDAILLGSDPSAKPAARSSIVLMRSGGELRALHVDAFAGRTEIVVKPLSKLFKDTKGFSGATILGDGRVLLIVDPRTIFSTQEPTR